MRPILLFLGTLGLALTAATHSWGQAAAESRIVGVNPPEQRIEEALDQPTAVRFIETPLAEAAEQLAKQHDIPILIDRRALEEIGLDSEVGVNISLSGASLRSTLRLLLRDLDMTYAIRDEVLMLTTLEAAEDSLAVRIYTLPPELATHSDRVVKVIQTTMVPDTWGTLGGPSTATPLDHLIVVSTTDDVHHRLGAFLDRLCDTYIDAMPERGTSRTE